MKTSALVIALLMFTALPGYVGAQATNERGQLPSGPKSREQLQKMAEALHERNAKELEALQSGFRDPTANIIAFQPSSICRAAIGAIMALSPSIIETDREEQGIVTNTYVRPDDKTRQSQRCKIQGNRVVWATSTGRWRDHPQDEAITFKQSTKGLTIRQQFLDGSFIENLYSASDFK